MNYEIEKIVEIAIRKSVLPIDGIHGIHHWNRVWENGKRISEITGANIHVVELFSFLHDCCRKSDNNDPEHGPRASKLVKGLVGDFITGEEVEIYQLILAIKDHTNGNIINDMTIATCWDADRLDFGRIGIKPNKKYLNTIIKENREFIEEAYKRSCQ